eukprot:1142540-Pelagomonas_calceolata.AAC.3
MGVHGGKGLNKEGSEDETNAPALSLMYKLHPQFRLESQQAEGVNNPLVWQKNQQSVGFDVESTLCSKLVGFAHHGGETQRACSSASLHASSVLSAALH